MMAAVCIGTSAAKAKQGGNAYDLNRPFGWACCTALTSGDDYQMTGGAAKGARTVVLKSTGQDMHDAIIAAIEQNDSIILDGSAGPFTVSTTMYLRDLKNKTVIGRNGARVCTQFVLTPEIRQMMDDNHVLGLSTAGGATPYVLPSGARVREECEYTIRKLLIEKLNDPRENFRHCGLFNLNGCENMVFRNLTLVGPGAIDIGGDDLMTATHGTRHLWVDHVEFIDGVDGNFDINGFSDFITVSWCRFRYTERTYVHANTNLIGSNDRAEMNGEDNLNVTYYACEWGERCNQRMPMVRFGTIHLLNCYYNCARNAAAINPRFHSEVLIEGCSFAPGVKNIFKQTDAKAYVFRNNIYAEQFQQPADLGTVTLPYKYQTMPTTEVADIVHKYAGACFN